MKAALEHLLARHDLALADAESLAVALADPAAPAPLVAAILIALRAKGETADELAGFARGMRSVARRPAFSDHPGPPAVDIVGTGGDSSGSVNLSTGAALLTAAAAGGQLRVVKHGNRAVSGRCGSADVLEALNIPITLGDHAAAAALARSGFVFLFAPHYHPAMKAIAPIRRELGVRTIFNLLGPLTNPAAPPYSVIGAHSLPAARLLADALSRLPITRAFVVHGAEGWDEPTPIGPFTLLDVHPNSVRESTRDPAAHGLPRCTPSDLRGGDAPENARALRHALGGEPSAHRDALILGASLALEVAGLEQSPESATARAAEAIDSGRAAATLDRLATPAASNSPEPRHA